MQRNFLWFQIDDLAFKLLLLGLALVLILLAAFAFFIWLWQRHRTATRRAKVRAAEQQQKSPKSLDTCFTVPADHLGKNEAAAFFVVPLERSNQNNIGNGPTTNGNARSLTAAKQRNGTNYRNNVEATTNTNGFSAFFQGSPSQPSKNQQQLPYHSPLSPSPLNAADYLDLEEGEGPKSLIRLNDDNFEEVELNSNGIDSKINGNIVPTGFDDDGRHSLRKDSIRPVNGSQLGNEKLSLKNRPFKITVNDDNIINKEEADMRKPNGKIENKIQQKVSPLMSRRYIMEKVPESENERLYGEFEALNQQFMCTLRPRSSSAELVENIRKNRYYDILPFEFNRVKLYWANSAYGGTDGRSDFINASYIETEGMLAYIAAQGPIGVEESSDGRRVNTVRDFWEMIWQEQVNCVVMLTQIIEGIKQKCAQYWPDSPGESEHYGPDLSVHLYCVTEDDICIQRELWVHKKGQPERKVYQWHFKEWRDSTGPSEVDSLLSFMTNVRESSKRRPILVHCSAGVGRTGVFIALDILLDKVAKEHVIDVKDTVSRLRAQRTCMVQTVEQYVSVYEGIAQAIRKKSTK